MPGHSFEDRQRKAGYSSFVRGPVDTIPAPTRGTISFASSDPAKKSNREFNEELERQQREEEQKRGTPLTGQGSTVNTQAQIDNLKNIVGDDKFKDIARDAVGIRTLGTLFDEGPTSGNVLFELGKLNLLGQKVPYNKEILKLLQNEMKQSPIDYGIFDYMPISQLEGFSGIKGVGKLRGKQFSDIAGGIFGKDLTFRDEDGNIVDPNNIDATGLMLRDKTTGKMVSLTREGFLDSFEEGFFDKLKRDDPITYYKITDDQPQTATDIEDLANVDLSELGKSPEDRRLAARVMEARAFMSDKRSRQDADMAQASPAFAPPTTPAPGTPAPPPAPPIFPGFPGTPTPGLPIPGTPTRPVVTNYSNMPTYAQLGIPTFLGDPRFAQFRDTLNLFPRV